MKNGRLIKGIKELSLILIDEQINYDIETCPFPRNLLEQFKEEGCLVYGLVDDTEKRVYLWDRMCNTEKRPVIIHEALHTHCYLNGLNWTERKINNESKRMYRQLYGNSAPILKSNHFGED